MDRTPTRTHLLVEDEHVLRELVAQFLRGEGFRVVEAADGAQGISAFSVFGPFELVLLDLNLPLLSGVEVCRRIKAERPQQPVLICSGAILDEHLSALEPLGVNGYLPKPFHPVELLERIAAVISAEPSADARADRGTTPAPAWRTDGRHRTSSSGPHPGQTATVRLR
jgi:DNA-binding response OmpR family regulator